MLTVFILQRTYFTYAKQYSYCCQDKQYEFVYVISENARPSDKDDLRSELATMRGMEPHPNILNFLGMCSETGLSATITVEWVEASHTRQRHLDLC